MALVWANGFRHFCYLNGNNSPYAYDAFSEILAVGNAPATELSEEPLNEFSELFEAKKDFFGFLSYELLSDKKTLGSKGSFFSPETIIRFLNSETIEIESIKEPNDIFKFIIKANNKGGIFHKKIQFQARLNKEEYVSTIEKLKQHINRGDIYQLNFCIDFEAKEAIIDPILFYQKLNQKSPMPFSGLLKLNEKYIICASPERYLKRINTKVISQPMKGTAPRNSDPIIDQNNLKELINSTKERAENTMIVDLVRNDLSRFCKSGTVKVEHLCEIYSFDPVHQMVSTVVGTLEKNAKPRDIFADTFPMGSMTGAPKIRAMELIEQYEAIPRGAFSGAMGYIKPNGNFDFNVLIRSVFYDAQQHTLSYNVGSGITAMSDSESEYEECMLKASTIQHVLSNYSENIFSN